MIESYLYDRQQFVSINDSTSFLKSISKGFPQGSILGPLLFLIYVNDLKNATSFQPRLFADNTCLNLNNTTINDLENNCNSELRILHNWCYANESQINPEKSTAIIFPPKVSFPEPELDLIYNISNILIYDPSKYLGVTMDCWLNFKPHILSFETRASRSVDILIKLRFIFPSSTFLLLYCALVHHHLI